MGKVTIHREQILEMERKRVVAALNRAGFKIVPIVQEATPYLTGKARNSVTYEVEERERSVTLRYGGTVDYYIWIEVGTHGRPGAAPLARTFSQALAIVERELGQ